MAEYPLGRFVWHECLTGDVDAAVDYYGKLIGWGSMVWEGEMGPYTMFTQGETPAAGVMELPPEAKQGGAPHHWLGYISTPDTDATTEQVAGLGGGVLVAPMTIPAVGRMAVLTDPQGAVFACYTPDTMQGDVDAPPQVGGFSWHELMTTDWEAAFAFYATAFGWEKMEAMDMGELGTYQMFGVPGGERPLGGMFNKPPEVPVPNWLFYAMVSDVDQAAEQITALGGTVLNGPMEVPGGDRVVQALDPQGAPFALHSTAS
jgi:predicted enzyme related to lactoylglutathione lyase